MTKQVTKNPVGWFEVYVEDMARAKKFYETVFQVKLDKLDGPMSKMEGFEMWLFPSDMTQYGAAGALVRMPGMVSGNNSVLIYFSCDDCAVEEARIKQHGGKVEKPKFSIGDHGFISIVVDSEGNMFGLHSMK